MAQIVWNDFGDRIFEVGVDRGVFYDTAGAGYGWNGLISVTESLSGGEATPYYFDGRKYLNIAGREEFGGTIEAYTYPNKFAEYDGTSELYEGLSINLQPRKQFSLSYRTRIGNDISSHEHGYKIHIIYNMMAAPSEVAYISMGSEVEPTAFSWSFTTNPIYVDATHNRTAHISIDSTKVSPAMVRAIEEHLYGTATAEPKLISLETLIYWFQSGGEPLDIYPNVPAGLAELQTAAKGEPDDLKATDNAGIYTKTSGSGLSETAPDSGTNNLSA